MSLMSLLCLLISATVFAYSCCNAASHKDTGNAELTEDHKGKVTS